MSRFLGSRGRSALDQFEEFAGVAIFIPRALCQLRVRIRGETVVDARGQPKGGGNSQRNDVCLAADYGGVEEAGGTTEGNRHVDRGKLDPIGSQTVSQFSRTDLGAEFVQGTAKIVDSVEGECVLDDLVGRKRLLEEIEVAKVKNIATQMEEDRRDRRERLWNLPFGFLPLMVRKVATQEVEEWY